MAAPEPSASGSAEPQKSSNKPFFIAFILGALVLTALPLLQERFLKAPPPILTLTPWSTPAADVSSTALEGKVVLLQVELAPCDADCGKRVTEFGNIVGHVNDLGDKVVLVTLADTQTLAGLEQQKVLTRGGSQGENSASAAWRFAELDSALVTQLQVGLVKFLGSDSTDFARSHSIVLIDQNQAVRGYWQDGTAGRGNAINAARLLAKKGPIP